MKYIYLVIKRIQNNLQEKTLLMLLYIGSYILCVLVFLFVYSNFSPTAARLGQNNSQDRYYKLSLENGEIDINNTISVIEKYSPDYINFYHKTEEGFCVAAFYNDNIEFLTVGGRIDISGYNGSYIVFPEDTEKYGYHPQTVTLEGRKYSVLGWTASDIDCAVSLSGYIENGYRTDEVEFYVRQVLSDSANSALLDELSKYMNIDGYKSPADYYEIEKNASKVILVSISIGFIVMMLVFGFLVKYIVKSENRENVIYRLVGGSQGELVGIIMMEQLVLNLVLSVTASALHFLLFNGAFEFLNLYRNISMTFVDYALVIALTTVMSFFVITPYLIHSVRQSSLAYRKE